MVLGAKEKIPEWKVHLKVLDCGPRFRGYNKKEFALPHEQVQIQAMAQEMEDNARKEIKKKGLTDKDAEYHLLLKKANDKFHSAVTSVQKSESYDIMAEVGAITLKKGSAPDVTQKVIDALP